MTNGPFNTRRLDPAELAPDLLRIQKLELTPPIWPISGVVSEGIWSFPG
jgi:hypothetical protein